MQRPRSVVRLVTEQIHNHSVRGNFCSTLRSKLASCGGQATSVSTSRKLALACAGLGINGNAFFYGTCFGGSFKAIEERLGPTCRRVLQGKGVKGPRRAFSSPRIQLHASPRGISTSVNDDLSQLFVAAAGPAAFASGYGNSHVWPAMMAAGVMTLVNALASPVHTPAADRAHHAVARVLWTYGLRQLDYGPKGIFSLGPVFEFLRLDNIVERPLWLLCHLGAGYLPLVDCHFEDWSPLCPWRWPGNPPDWLPLWHGPLFARLRGKGLNFCHVIAAAGVAELANLCDEENFGFLDEAAILCAHPRAVELGAAQAKKEIHALMGAIRACHISPVPGRGGWAMADAADGYIPSYAPTEFGLFRQFCVSDLAAQKRSGDGGILLADRLGVTITLPPLQTLLDTLPREPVPAIFNHPITGDPLSFMVSFSSIESLLRNYHELIPVLLNIVTTPTYLANPSVFWSACIQARTLALCLISDPSTLPSSDALEGVRAMRAQGVDWLQWLTARPEDTRREARREAVGDDDADEDDLSGQVAPKQSADDRAATLLERRDALRSDDEARQRLHDTLRDHLNRDYCSEASHRMVQWLREGDVWDSPSEGSPRPQVSPTSVLLDTEVPGSSFSTAAEWRAPDIFPKDAPPWQRELLLPVDLPCSVRLPDLIAREAVRPPLDTDEACRVIRCTDAFGILLIGLSSQAPPNDATVHRAFVEAKSRLEGAQSRSERGPYAVRHPRWQLARRRVNGAWVALADPQTRLQIWSKWMLQRKGPTTSSVQCVIHAAALRALAASPSAPAPGRSPGVTIGGEIAELLRASSDHPHHPDLRILDIEYRHSERGARLIAAGFVRYSREYAIGPDPFRCSKPVPFHRPSVGTSQPPGYLHTSSDSARQRPTSGAPCGFLCPRGGLESSIIVSSGHRWTLSTRPRRCFTQSHLLL